MDAAEQCRATEGDGYWEGDDDEEANDIDRNVSREGEEIYAVSEKWKRINPNILIIISSHNLRFIFNLFNN